MAMTVSDLRAALAHLPDDMPVVMASDAEGNDHSPLDDAAQAMYMAENAWSGEVYVTPEDLVTLTSNPESGWSEDDAAPDGAVRVLLLGPVH